MTKSETAGKGAPDAAPKNTPDGCNIFSKWLEVQKALRYVQKDGTNTHFKYKFASYEAVATKLSEVMDEQKIIRSSSTSTPQFVSPDGKNVIMKITQQFLCTETRTALTFEGIGQGQDSGDKAAMKANTAALKYLIAAATGLSWGDDPEADEKTDKAQATGKTEAPKRPAKKTNGEKPATEKTVADLENPADVAAAIAGADTVEALKKLIGRIKQFEGDAKVSASLKDRYVKRKKELTPQEAEA